MNPNVARYYTLSGWLLILSLLSFGSLNAQDACIKNFTSSDGYTVNIELTPVEIIAPSSCQWGYNFNVQIDYSITFSGSNIPASLYTMQGNMECSSWTNNFFNLPNAGGSGTTTTTGNPWNGNSDCQTATVESLGCENISISIEGSGLGSQTFSCPVASPLPIKLLSFEVIPEEGQVYFIWKTASEINNDYFTLEVSRDAKKWSEITRIPGAGNSRIEKKYSFAYVPEISGDAYFRLKQTDYNGKMTTYPAIAVSLGELNFRQQAYYDYSRHAIVVFGTPEELETVTLYDVHGVERGRFHAVDLISDELLIDAGRLTPGIHLVKTASRVHRIMVE